jgi:hypothetical protein
MPHIIEVAKSGRASCRGCRDKIEKDAFRFGEEVPNVFAQDAGPAFRYWHLTCAATKLANDLREALKTVDLAIPDRAALEATIAEHAHPDYPYAELAPNGRAKCRVCQESVGKGVMRIVFERTVESSMGLTRGPGYVHVACVMRYPDASALGHSELTRLLIAHSKLDPEAVNEVVRNVNESTTS